MLLQIRFFGGDWRRVWEILQNFLVLMVLVTWKPKLLQKEDSNNFCPEVQPRITHPHLYSPLPVTLRLTCTWVTSLICGFTVSPMSLEPLGRQRTDSGKAVEVVSCSIRRFLGEMESAHRSIPSPFHASSNCRAWCVWSSQWCQASRPGHREYMGKHFTLHWPSQLWYSTDVENRFSSCVERIFSCFHLIINPN